MSDEPIYAYYKFKVVLVDGGTFQLYIDGKLNQAYIHAYAVSDNDPNDMVNTALAVLTNVGILPPP